MLLIYFEISSLIAINVSINKTRDDSKILIRFGFVILDLYNNVYILIYVI